MLTPLRPGPCPITVEYTGSRRRGALTLGTEWTVRASRELLEQLESLVGRGGVQVVYGAPRPGGIERARSPTATGSAPVRPQASCSPARRDSRNLASFSLR